MNWGNTKESITDLMLTIGTTIIVIGFINWGKFTPLEIIISGLIITGIGVIRAIKNMRKKGIVPDWEKHKEKKKK